MGLSHDKDEHWIAAAGDSLELLARAFAEPTVEVACAISEGTLQADALSCAEDLGVASEVDEALHALRVFEGVNEVELLSSMRCAHSVLYMVPASKNRIFPYEGAFCFEADKRPGNPLVFSNRAAADMEKLMKAEGLKPEESLHDPADSIWFELAFLSHLYGLLLLQLSEGNDGTVAAEHIAEFQKKHGRVWMLTFMAATARRAPEVKDAEIYRDLALLGEVLLRKIFDEEE